MTDLVPRLQNALQDRYRIERELGQGGMAVVYLAHDRKLGRPVALKVLRPELAASLGAERFLREIEIAARLTHPNILPLHDCGEADGLLYYTMPFVEGESLSDRLSREKQLPIEEAVRITREVGDALGHAHARGLIHRDVKPGNILLAAGHALLSDFGIARAVSAAGTEALTQTGFAVGTPIYMSPEQASGRQDIDGRSDIYSLGCVLYEMLAGEPPYGGPTPAAVVAKKLSEPTPRISVVRETVRPRVEEALAKALARVPADRFATAAQFVETLGGGDAPAVPTPRRSAIGIVAGTAAAVLVLARVLVVWLALPDWLWEAAIAVVAVGASVLVLGEWRRWGGQRRWLTGRRALAIGGTGLLALALTGAGYLASRTLGVGPFGTPISRGELGKQIPLVVADFDPIGADTNFADAVTELLRTRLLQSPVLHLLPRLERLQAQLRMRRPGRLDAGTAQELAQREGLAAVVSGEVRLVGGRYLLLATLTSVADPSVVVPAAKYASDSTDIIGTAERLADELRERTGESIRSIRASPPLMQVTTASLEALRAFTAAWRGRSGPQFIALARKAISLDSSFAAAYWLLGLALETSGRSEEARLAYDSAYRYRERLPDRERLLAEASFFRRHLQPEKEEPVLLQLLALSPSSAHMHVNLSDFRLRQGRFAEAESLALRAVQLGDSGQIPYWNALEAQLAQGHLAAAESLAMRAPPALQLERYVLMGLRDWDRAQAAVEAAHDGHHLRVLQGLHGKLALDERPLGTERRWWPLQLLRYTGDTARAFRAMREWRAFLGWDTLPPAARPYFVLIPTLAEGGRVDEARRMLDEWRRLVPDDPRHRSDESWSLGAIALAEGRLDSAAVAFLAWNRAPFAEDNHRYNRGLTEAAIAFDRAGRADTAIALYERALTTHSMEGIFYEATWYPLLLRRLGALHQSLGHTAQAIHYYREFVELWKDADPELQPQVREARATLERLTREARG